MIIDNARWSEYYFFVMQSIGFISDASVIIKKVFVLPILISRYLAEYYLNNKAETVVYVSITVLSVI